MQSLRISVQARVAGAGLTKQRSVVGRCEFYVVDLSAVLVHTTVSESVAGSGCLLYKIRRIEIVGERIEYVFLHIRLHIFGGGVVGTVSVSLYSYNMLFAVLLTSNLVCSKLSPIFNGFDAINFEKSDSLSANDLFSTATLSLNLRVDRIDLDVGVVPVL